MKKQEENVLCEKTKKLHVFARLPCLVCGYRCKMAEFGKASASDGGWEIAFINSRVANMSVVASKKWTKTGKKRRGAEAELRSAPCCASEMK